MRGARGAPLALLLAVALAAQVLPPGPQALSFFSAVDDTDQPYALYLPKDFDASRKYPLVVSLHGAGSNHRLNLRRVFGKGNLPGQTDSEASRGFPPLPEVGFLVVSPLARGTIGYQGIGERDVYDVVDDVKKRFPVDEDRVYLTGLSMGGGGTLWLGLTRPDLWAAIAPVCAAEAPGTAELAPNALNLPVRLFHGEMDPLVPAASSRLWHKRLLDLGTAVEYLEFPGVRHNAWDHAYRNAAIFDWFAAHRRNRFPERVRFTTRHYEYAAAYWVRIDALTPGTLASIDARFTGPNRISVETHELDGFSLNLAGHPAFQPGKPLFVFINGAERTAKGGPGFSWKRAAEGWVPGRFEHGGEEKRPGAEGPIRRAVSGRHLYVYGVADSPGEAEAERRRQQAHAAADWSWSRFHPYLQLRVMADRDVLDQDIHGTDLVLFGTRETNRLIARWAGSLPLHLNAGAADYGLVQVAHIEGRYLLVSSGLPWWTSSSAPPPSVPRYLPLHLSLLLGFPDYVLFRSSPGNVIAEGYFDRMWKVPAEAAGAIKATGAVVVR